MLWSTAWPVLALVLSLSLSSIFEGDDEKDQCQIKILQTEKREKSRGNAKGAELKVKGEIRNTCVR